MLLTGDPERRGGNLLADPVFSVGADMALSLPGVFAASARGEIRGFSRLRAHQRTAWHMFRVQLAALALRGAGLEEPPEDAETWVRLLRALAPEHDDDPWRLVVVDRSRPAFLQPPDPGGMSWVRVETPDALDLLITARNHDVKRSIAAVATTEDWVHALVSLQTGEGYGGSGNYGIARMNGGSSSRPFLGLVPTGADGAPNLSAWWRRDVAVLLRTRNDETPLTRGGPGLLWCEEWKEGQSLPVQQMDPWAIEVCRRVRLLGCDGQLVAERAGSKAARLQAKTFNGALGDAWAPVSLVEKARKTLTLGEGRFDYRRIVDLMLTGNWEVPVAARVYSDESAGDMVLLAEALSRGNSKTDGLQSRLVPVPQRARGIFRTDSQRLADLAALQIQEIAEADAALREAVALYAAGGDRGKVGRDQRRRAAEARARLDRAADEAFFESLWSRAVGESAYADSEPEAGATFRALLVSTAHHELERAFQSLPCASAQAPRARVRATARLRGGLRKGGLVDVPNEEIENA